jgi:hypothetical protein
MMIAFIVDLGCPFEDGWNLLCVTFNSPAKNKWKKGLGSFSSLLQEKADLVYSLFTQEDMRISKSLKRLKTVWHRHCLSGKKKFFLHQDN